MSAYIGGGSWRPIQEQTERGGGGSPSESTRVNNIYTGRVVGSVHHVRVWDVDAAADAAAAVDAAVAVDAAGAAVGVVAKVDFSWRCAKDALARFAPRRAKMGVDKSSGVGSSIRSLSGERKRCSEVADDEDADFLRLLVLAMAAPRD